MARLRRGERLIIAKPQAWRLAWFAGLFWFGAVASRADTHYVAQASQTEVPNYTNWADASSNIQHAINVAGANDTVLVSNGTYNLTNQISITNITVRSLNGTNLTFVNGNNYVGKPVTNRCFYIDHSVLNGFTVSNGFARDSSGGGIYIKNTGLVYNCFISGNTASNISQSSGAGGGGVYISVGGIVSNCSIVNNTFWDNADRTLASVGGGGADLYDDGILTESYISGNVSYWNGGGVCINRAYGNRPPGGTECIVTNCVVTDNRAKKDGGGVYMCYGCVVATCVISNNVAEKNGGGIINGSGTVKNSIIIGNTASNSYGGATAGGGDSTWTTGGIMSNCQVIANWARSGSAGGVGMAGLMNTSQVVNCIIARNRADGSYGGGIFLSDRGLIKNCLIYCNTNQGAWTGVGGGVWLGNQTKYQYPVGLINCTIVSNREIGTSTSRGGGLYVDGTNYIANCIIYDNTAATASPNIYNNTAANTNNYWNTCSLGSDLLAPNQGNSTNNPLFIDQGNRNYRLSKGSPCINAGINLLPWMAGDYDLDGRVRIRYGKVDMGAYEAIYGGTMCVFR